MSDDYDYGYDVYGDTDPNNVPNGGGGQDTTAGDGLPGFPVDGYPEWRAGVFGAGNGLLGMMPVADAGAPSASAPADGASPQAGGIDWGFIHGREASAGQRTQMVVPVDKHQRVVDKSGPTIGYGFDVGQHSPADLRQLGLSQPLVDALSPYTRMQGRAAQAYVKAHPLTLATSDVDAIDQAVQDKSTRDLAAKFDAASQVGSFASLPTNAQTAIADLYHQYGPGLPSKAPNFWHQVTGGDWQGAYGNLMGFHDHFPTRRQAEAGLLQQDIHAGHVPRAAR